MPPARPATTRAPTLEWGLPPGRLRPADNPSSLGAGPAGPRGQVMRAVIVGGAGFVGLNIAEAMLAAGHDVTVFDRAAVPAAATAAFAGLPGRFERTSRYFDTSKPH